MQSNALLGLCKKAHVRLAELAKGALCKKALRRKRGAWVLNKRQRHRLGANAQLKKEEERIVLDTGKNVLAALQKGESFFCRLSHSLHTESRAYGKKGNVHNALQYAGNRVGVEIAKTRRGRC